MSLTFRDWREVNVPLVPPLLPRETVVLARARGAAAHGDETHADVLEARAQRSDLVDSARMLVVQAFAAEPDFPLYMEFVARAPDCLGADWGRAMSPHPLDSSRGAEI